MARGAMQRPIVCRRRARAKRIGGADPCSLERLFDQSTEVLGLPEFGETAECAVAVWRSRVDQDTRYVGRFAIPRGIDPLANTRGTVATFECQLANEDVSEAVQQDIRDPGEVGFRRRQFPGGAKCLVALQQRGFSCPLTLAAQAMPPGARY